MEILGCKFAPGKKYKVEEPLQRGVNDFKQEVAVQLKKDRVFCTQKHEFLRVPMPQNSEVADVSARCDLCDCDMCETCAAK